jgi:hypothetical protein
LSFSPAGVEFVARNLRGYLSDLKQADQAQQAVGRSAAGIGGKFGQAQGQAQSFGRAVSGLGSNVAGLGSSLNSSLSSLSGFGSALSNVAQIAAGNLLASGISTFVGGVKEFISIGADAVGEAQKLEAGLGALLTQNNLYERQTKEVTVAVGNLGEMQAEAALKSEDLAFKQRELTADINRQNAAIQEQRQRIIQMADGLDKTEQVAKLQQMEIALEGMNRELVRTGQEQGKLTSITQEYTTATVTSYEQINSFSEAQRLAAEQTQELLGFVDKLSIISPFESDQVALVTKFAVGAGLAVDEAKNFTAGFLDLAAAVGIGSEELSFASDQLLQVAKVGQITTVDLRQLRRLGIDLEKIIGVQMGLSIDEFNEKAKQSPEIFQELFNGVAEFSAKTFPGAAQKLASSLGGISSTFKDIFRVSAKNLLRPMVDAAGPAMSAFLGNLASVATGPELAGIGQRLGEVLGQGIARAQEAIATVTGAFGRFGARGAGVSILGMLGLDPTQIAGVMGVADQVVAGIDKIQGAYERFGLRGAATSLLGQLGLEPETINTLRNVADTIIEIVSSISFDEILGAFTGIGAALGGGAIAGLIAGVGAAIFGLLTPVNLIIAGAGLLGAAWGGNWFGIRDTVTQAWATIQPVLLDLWTWLQTTIPAAIATVSDIWNNTLKPGFTQIADTVSSQLLPALQELFNAFSSGTGGTQGFADLWTNTLWPALQNVGAFIRDVLFPAWVDLEVFLVGALSVAITTLAGYWENILFPAISTVAGFVKDTVIPALSDLWDWLGPKIGDGIQALSDLWTGTLQPAMLAVWSWSNENLIPLLESIGNLFNAVIGKALEGAAGLWQNVLLPALKRVGSYLKDTVFPVFMDVAGAVKEDVSPVLKDLGEVVFPILQEGLDYVTEAIKDVIAYFDSLADKVSSFSLPDILQPGSPPPMAYALWDVASGASDAAAAVKQMGQNMLTGKGVAKDFFGSLQAGGIAKQLQVSNWNDLRDILQGNTQTAMNILGSGGGAGEIMALVQSQSAKWGVAPSFTASIVEANGLIEHLIDGYGEFARIAKLESLGNLVQLAGSFAGIGSSFSDMLEQQMAGGAEAIKTVEAYRVSLNKLIATEGNNQIAVDKKQLAIEKANEALDFGKRQMAIYQQELEALMLDEEGNALQIEKKVLQMDRLTESMDAQGKTLVTLQDELARLTGEMDKNQKAVEEARKGYKALQAQAFNLFSGNQTDAEKIQSELATIALLQDFLKSGDSNLLIPADAVSQAAGITGVLYDQISGQQELNRLLAEQQRREELITQQKEAQQKLNFLQQQLELIKLGRELGGDIFQGITFGLNASVEDLLAATNAITMAMVDQINSDLQIASPSKLMIKTFKQVMAGAAIGMEQGQGLLSEAVRGVPILNGNVPQPAFSQAAMAGGNTYNTYYEMPMTVSTAATPQGVIRQYEIKRSMYATG